jgi:hypothetical protein
VPKYFPSWTKCTAPGKFKPVPAFASLFFVGAGASGLILTLLAGATASFGTSLLFVALCGGAITFCHWWLDVRLICLGGDRSAIGAIYSLEPFAFSSDWFDTDYSFNLLLWGFMPQQVLPADFVANEWSPSALGQLAAEWSTLSQHGLVPNLAWSAVAPCVTLIAAQPSMAQAVATYGISFHGQGVDSSDVIKPPLANSSSQHFVAHCEIEGSGMHDALVLLSAMSVVFAVAAVVSVIPPPWGTALSWLLWLLALLGLAIGGCAINNNPTSPPKTGGWGGSFNPYRPGGDPNQTVDLAYVFGRWVCDTGFMHPAANELHPVHFMCKIGQTTQGAIAAEQWPGALNTVQTKLDAFVAYINTPAASALQAQPENQWTVHPVLDGCEGSTPYPQPPAPNPYV